MPHTKQQSTIWHCFLCVYELMFDTLLSDSSSHNQKQQSKYKKPFRSYKPGILSGSHGISCATTQKLISSLLHWKQSALGWQSISVISTRSKPGRDGQMRESMDSLTKEEISFSICFVNVQMCPPLQLTHTCHIHTTMTKQLKHWKVHQSGEAMSKLEVGWTEMATHISGT